MYGADDVRFQFGKPPFGIPGQPLDQRFADEETQNRIAQEFELLVILQGRTARNRFFVHV